MNQIDDLHWVRWSFFKQYWFSICTDVRHRNIWIHLKPFHCEGYNPPRSPSACWDTCCSFLSRQGEKMKLTVNSVQLGRYSKLFYDVFSFTSLLSLCYSMRRKFKIYTLIYQENYSKVPLYVILWMVEKKLLSHSHECALNYKLTACK